MKSKYPIYIKETKEWRLKNIFRLENWKLDWKEALIIFLIIFGSLAYDNDTEQCFELLKNPCDFVDAYDCQGFPFPEDVDFTHPDFDIYDAGLT